ncbi:HAAAP family serine/threonine permease [Legionella geestiana]|uniref:HAAAP family serine/threonine permease n=1 Tax=Legionella geestiana TaxID=45065 RepID=UPI001092A7D6|nr:HAAAP family serine/threonine permease [Legionella geestiana]QDQ40980.1 HAAAP family serine/threonine permease [Legionella geestiana]
MISNAAELCEQTKTLARAPSDAADSLWVCGLFGTAIGAGTLFLPINAGLSGFWPLIFVSLLAFPMTHFSHRALCRFVLSGSNTSRDITDVSREHFGPMAGNLLTWLYFLSIYPILLMYSVALTNTTSSFMVHQLNMTPPPRALLALLLVGALMAVVRMGENVIVRVMRMLVYPFILVLLALAVWLIPEWNGAVFTEARALTDTATWSSLWLTLPVMVFAFNHSPVISAFAKSQKTADALQADTNASRILRKSHLLMVLTVLFFVFSCVFSLSPNDLLEAKAQNISILSYLANHFDTPFISVLAPCIAFIAIAKSFFGHYLGAREGIEGILQQALARKPANLFRRRCAIDAFMLVSCWAVATLNPGILSMIESLGGPIIALLLFLMPMYAFTRIPALKKYRSRFSDSFTIIIGLLAVSAILYGFF